MEDNNKNSGGHGERNRAINSISQNSKSESELHNIAFVVLSWNSEEYIGKCLESITGCTSINPFIYVVDNASRDESFVLIENFVSSHKNVKVFKQENNLGTTVSRNIALKHIDKTCDYICILDSDTEVNDEALVCLIETLQADASIGLVGPTMVNGDGDIQLSGRNLPSLKIKAYKACPIKFLQNRGAAKEVPDTPIVNNLQEVPYLLSACWLMRRNLLEKIGFFDENIFYAPEDVDYCIRVWNQGLRVVRCYDAQIIHEYQRISKKKLVSKTNLEHLKGLIYYFKKYGYVFNSNKAIRTAEIGSE